MLYNMLSNINLYKTSLGDVYYEDILSCTLNERRLVLSLQRFTCHRKRRHDNAFKMVYGNNRYPTVLF